MLPGLSASAGGDLKARAAGEDPAALHPHRDRVVMTTAKIALEPIFEAQFLPSSFGFRPNRSAHDALEVVRTKAHRGAEWVLDADLTDCFGRSRTTP